MPTPTTDPVPVAPIRVAECRHCGQLFAVYAATGEVACPACEATSKVASLQIVELGVAAPVEVKVEASPTAPTPIESMGPAGEPMSIEQPVADIELPVANLVAEAPGPEADEPQRPPTVAEWLLQSEQLSEPKPTPTEPKRSLAESLGWKPGGFEVPSLAAQRSGTAARSEAQQGELADHAEPIATSLADFRFDFGATPLSEQSGPLSEQDELPSGQDEYDTGDIDGVSLELSAPAEDAPQPLQLDSLAGSARHSRGWGSFVGMAIGLMLIAGPAAYLAVTWNSDDSAAELASLDGRLLSEEAPAETAVEPSESSTQKVAPPQPFTAADPFVDSSTQPASFDKEPASFGKEPASFDTGGTDEPEFNLPPSAPTEVERPASASDNPSMDDPSQGASDRPTATTPEADPFLAPRPSAATTRQAMTPTPAAEDRYEASPAPAEPAAFAPPEEKIDPMVEPAAAMADPPSDPLAPPSQQVGLVNAPEYGARELAEAFSPAEAAAIGFATGSLDDPAQVSTMGQHYAQLCHLAQVLTLLDTKDPSLMTAELQAADTFKRLLQDGRSRAQSRQIAGPWIAWTGRPHGGVFFAGLPDDVRRAGEVMQYQFRIGESVVPVVMAQAIDPARFQNSAEVGVIGVVVENPRQWIAGYEGDAQRVVWARKTLPLPRAEEL